MFSLYNFIIKSNKEIIARQQAIQQWYEFFERLNILMDDYTVDYEEYFNRQMVWCSEGEANFWRWTNFQRNVGLSWYCTNFTAYGNENSNLNNPANTYHDLYYCSSVRASSATLTNPRVLYPLSNCGKVLASFKNNNKQSYGQYAALFKNVRGWDWIIVWSDDDVELWYLANEDIDAIADSDDIQELYLISHDWTKRLYFRRKLDREDEIEGKKYKQYKIQMLRLRWFDAWRMHNFVNIPDNKGLYDGVIDTWACDYSMWFEPKNKNNANCDNPNSEGNSICWAYSDYYLPQDEDDCWIDLTQWTTDLFARDISISPKWDADLYWAKEARQINSYMKIFIINKVYFPSIFWSNKRIPDTIKDFSVPLETTINMKDFYRG